MTIKTSVKLPAVNDAGKIDANTIDKVTNSDGSISGCGCGCGSDSGPDWDPIQKDDGTIDKSQWEPIS